jgi:hypothetical protein
MNASTHKMRRLGILLVTALAVAAIVIPAAAARHDMGMGLVDADAWGVSEYAQPTSSVKGENYYARGIPAHLPPSTPAVSASSSTAFQWGDAGIGAGLALGLTVLTTGGLLVARRQRGALRTS